MIGKLAKVMGYIGATVCIVVALTLIIFGLPFTGWKALSVQTGSMRPHINPGALVLVHRVPGSTLRVGDVITYNSKFVQGERITHRIVAFKQVGPIRDIVVKGDANKVPDPPLLPSQVVGKVAWHMPYAGRVVDFLHKPYGLAVFIYLPAVMIVIYELEVLVRRLTQLEVDEQRAQETTSSAWIRSRTKIVQPSVRIMSAPSASQPNPSRPTAQPLRLRGRARSIDGIMSQTA